MNERNRQRRRETMPPRHITERLADRAEATGCDRCGARFGDLLPYFIARSATRAWLVRCGNCLDGVTPVLVGAAFTGGDPWSHDDRAWFAAHPTRRWRLREPWPGELATIALGAGEAGREELAAFAEVIGSRGLRLAVAVFQPMTGRRAREPVGISTADPLGSFTDAGIVALVPGLASKAARIELMTDKECRRHWRERVEARFAILKTVVAPS